MGREIHARRAATAYAADRSRQSREVVVAPRGARVAVPRVVLHVPNCTSVSRAVVMALWPQRVRRQPAPLGDPGGCGQPSDQLPQLTGPHPNP